MLNVTAVDDDPDETVWSQMPPAAPRLVRTPSVVVCGVPLLFDHVMVSPTLIEMEPGEKKSFSIAADTAAGVGVVPPPPPPPVVPEVGVTALKEAEAPLVPTALVAVTMKV